MRDAANVVLDQPGCLERPCVVTIPAHFSVEQRNSTMDAIKMSGLVLLQILEEPTAAALAEGF